MLLFEPDLLFSSKIESSSRRAGLDVKVVATANELQQAVRDEVPTMLLVNLDALEGDLKSLVELLKGKCRLIGYYLHVNSTLGRNALAEGFEVAIPRSAFAAALGEILATTRSG